MQTLESARELLAPIDKYNYFEHSAKPADPLNSVWSKSALKSLTTDVADWLSNRPFDVTEAMKFGSLVDDYLLWPEEFNKKYGILPTDCPLNRNPGKADAARIRAQGKEPVKTKTMNRVFAIEKKFNESTHENVVDMLSGTYQFVVKCVAEITYTFKGNKRTLFIPLKSLLDSAKFDGNKVRINDMKVTGARNVEDIWSIFTGLCYHWQSELYTEGMKANGYDVEYFDFVFIQAEAPHRIQVARADENLQMAARTGLTKAFMTLALLNEGYTEEDFYPKVATFGVENPWRRFAELGHLTEKILDFKVDFHAGSA